VIKADTKDWTWVLHEPCPECGFVAEALERADLGPLLRDDAVGWTAVLAQPGASDRPDEDTWSPLEYACHVRDVHRVFVERLALMLDQDAPTFANWDQDETALAERYAEQDPAVVGPELVAAAETIAAQYDALRDAPEETWARRGLRSNGTEFTVDTLARYHLHDVLHHSHDVRDFAARATAAAYDGDATAYGEATARMNDGTRAELDWFAGALGGAGAVLEIGSGGGRDAAGLQERGLAVRCTDVSAGFVELLRSRGLDAEVLDPLTGDLGGPYDGVWASASLLHVARRDLPTVLLRLAEATRDGGALGATLKEGDGERWSVHGQVRAQRRFVYWREVPLREALEGAGWHVEECRHDLGQDGGAWLTIRAVRTKR
jgi:SAM-dependent methyltransferase